MNYSDLLIGIIGTIIGMVITCSVQNYVENKKLKYQDNKDKCAIFVDFIMSILETTKGNTTKDLLEVHNKVIRDCLIYGSHKLIKKWNKMHNAIQNPNISNKTKLYYVADVIKTLRKDCGYAEMISRKEILKCLRISDV